MGERVRTFFSRAVAENLDEIEEDLEHWLEDEAAGATVVRSLSVNAGRKTKTNPKPWLPRGYMKIAESGPSLVLGLVAELRRERARSSTPTPAADTYDMGLLRGVCMAAALCYRMGETTAASDILRDAGIREKSDLAGVDEYDAAPCRKVLAGGAHGTTTTIEAGQADGDDDAA